MKKNKLLIIGKIPPPMGGVTIHVSRIIDKLNTEKADQQKNIKIQYIQLFIQVLNS